MDEPILLGNFECSFSWSLRGSVPFCLIFLLSRFDFFGNDLFLVLGAAWLLLFLKLFRGKLNSSFFDACPSDILEFEHAFDHFGLHGYKS